MNRLLICEGLLFLLFVVLGFFIEGWERRFYMAALIMVGLLLLTYLGAVLWDLLTTWTHR